MFAEMPQRRKQSYTLCSLILFLLLPFLVLSSKSDVTNKFFIECSGDSHCGDLDINYPFRLNDRPEYCGYPGYEISCKSPNPTIKLEGEEYNVLDINYKKGHLVVVDSDFVVDQCPRIFTNTSINSNLFDFIDVDRNLTVYINCTLPNPQGLLKITCLNEMFPQKPSYYKVDNGPSGFLEDLSAGYMCDLTAAVAVYGTANEFSETLREGFGLRWKYDAGWCPECINSGGICGYNETTPRDPTCFCSNNTTLSSCPYKNSYWAIKKHQFVNHEVMAMMKERLGEDIIGLIFSGNVWKSNLMTNKGFTDGMTVHFNMLGVLMKNWIDNNLNSTNIINMKSNMGKLRYTKFTQQLSKPYNFRIGG